MKVIQRGEFVSFTIVFVSSTTFQALVREGFVVFLSFDGFKYGR